ncbi:MAG: hypothetical protein QOE94_3967, partial [Mycobacterium sp.]|nr:hypothetical protein [Mycobacterium sp.]
MDDITALAQELFGTTDIPEGYMREVKRHVATAAAWLGLATDSH